MKKLQIKKAEKKRMNGLLAIVGISGSGKTYSALNIASALIMGDASGKRICLIDTESGSGSLYSDIFDYDVVELEPPFHPDRFIEAIDLVRSVGGYGAIIIDSLSHSWIGKGGALSIVDDERTRSAGGNSHFAWRKVTPLNRNLFDEIRAARKDFHVIATMQSKTLYDHERRVENGQEKVIPVKIGMGPEIRSGSEYTFDVILEMDINNNARIDKSRCSDLKGKTFPKPGVEFSGILYQWLNSGADPEEEAQREEKKAAEENIAILQALDFMQRADTLRKWVEIAYYDFPGLTDIFANMGAVQSFRNFFEGTTVEFNVDNNYAINSALLAYIDALRSGETKHQAIEKARVEWNNGIAAQKAKRIAASAKNALDEMEQALKGDEEE